MRKLGLLAGAAAVAVLGAGALRPAPAAPPPNAASPPIADDAPAKETLPENFLQASPSVYVGGEPRGAAAFAALARQGIKTLVSVDGARPDVATAREYGLRYVHIPIGYDGVPSQAGAALTRLVREAEGPFYIHCHHGKHRGPAAAAVACRAAGELDAPGAGALLERAGTGAHYRGLWRDVAAWRPPPPDAPLPELVEVAQVDSLAAAMAKIDRNYDHLKLCAAAGWKTPPEHPDLSPPQEALLLREELRESSRRLADGYDALFRALLKETEQQAAALEQALRRGDSAAAAAQFQRIGKSCKDCHDQYRD